jgi:hypothetical protein
MNAKVSGLTVGLNVLGMGSPAFSILAASWSPRAAPWTLCLSGKPLPTRTDARRGQGNSKVFADRHRTQVQAETGNASRNIPNIGKNVPDTMCGLCDIRNNL